MSRIRTVGNYLEEPSDYYGEGNILFDTRGQRLPSRLVPEFEEEHPCV